MPIPTEALPRFPRKLSCEEFLPLAYYYCYLSRALDTTIGELFRKGYVKGTVTQGTGNEGTAVPLGLLFRPGFDVLSLLHRDTIVHLMQGVPLHTLLCQFMANAQSPTHGREGNVHHGNAAQRRFPMISHLGNMLAPAVGGVYAARTRGEECLGLAVIGDGGASTGDFHESLNIASVRKVPVLFLIENNEYAFSTPTSLQYRCTNLSDRHLGYGIEGKTVDGTDPWEVYTAACDALEYLQGESLPYLLETRTLRLNGHAVYDQAQYVTDRERALWRERDPLPRCLRAWKERCGADDHAVQEVEAQIDALIDKAVKTALAVARPSVQDHPLNVFAPAAAPTRLPPASASDLRCFSAVTLALRYLLENNADCFILGQDIGPYGSAFKTCKGLYELFGPQRILDMPIAESATVGFALGASQIGARPVMEFQFADFSTEAVTQLGLNCGTWFFRSGSPAPVVLRLPCGGGITLGAFHSGEFEGLWSRFPGLKLLYPSTPQEFFEALIAAFYDPNPCLVFENKSLYTSVKGDVDFDGNGERLWRSRRVEEGDQVTVIALGAMIELARQGARSAGVSIDLWNPFTLCPLDLDPLEASLRRTGRLMVVQESGATAGFGDRFVSLLTRAAFGSLTTAPILVSAPDVPVPFAPELELHYRPAAATIARALSQLTGDACV